MDSRTKVAYGLAVTSLAIGVLCAKATVDRVSAGVSLRIAETAVLALAVLDTKCGSGATIDWIEDEFADSMQDHANWCQGSIVQTIARWDSGSAYEFRGSASISPGLTFYWTRSPSLTDEQQPIRERLEQRAQDVSSGDSLPPLQVEVLRFEQTPPLLQGHELWFASVYVVNLNFGERILKKEWVAYLPEDVTVAYTPERLRQRVLREGVSAAIMGKDVDSVYRTLAADWAKQSVKVPLLNLELRYDFAVIALGAVAMLQLLWLAGALAGAKTEDDPRLYARLSLRQQMKEATHSDYSTRVIALLDWASLWGCVALSLGAPAICFACAFVAYWLTSADSAAVYTTAGLALLSAGLAVYILRRLRTLSSASPGAASAA